MEKLNGCLFPNSNETSVEILKKHSDFWEMTCHCRQIILMPEDHTGPVKCKCGLKWDLHFVGDNPRDHNWNEYPVLWNTKRPDSWGQMKSGERLYWQIANTNKISNWG